jgi:hypothetical protein
MFSQDEDLLAIAHAWQQSGREFAGLIYTHQMGITIGRAVKDLEIVAKAMDVSDMRNQVLFLPL